jgi:hypothetical protein
MCGGGDGDGAAAGSAGAPELDMAEGPAGSVDATATEAGTPAPLAVSGHLRSLPHPGLWTRASASEPSGGVPAAFFSYATRALASRLRVGMVGWLNG